MTGNHVIERKHLWISYPWASKEEKDFAYLVSQLRDARIEATYDSLQLQAQPDTRLGKRIIQRLQSINCDGWLYILTHQLLSRRNCADELIAAIDQTLVHMGQNFPIVGLLHGISAEQVPPVLRVRPCLSLGDPDWRCRVSQVLKERASFRRREPAREDMRYTWRIHSCYAGNPSMTAIEVGAKKASVHCWRFAIPKSANAVRWGVGTAGGGEISPVKFTVARGSGVYAGAQVSWFGAANAVTATESAYVVFSGQLPDFVCFGQAVSSLGPPGTMEIFKTALNQ